MDMEPKSSLDNSSLSSSAYCNINEEKEIDWIEIIDNPDSVYKIHSSSLSMTFSDSEESILTNFPPDIVENDSIIDKQFYLSTKSSPSLGREFRFVHF